MVTYNYSVGHAYPNLAVFEGSCRAQNLADVTLDKRFAVAAE